MPAESIQKFESLEAQAQRLMAVFTRAGYEYVAPSIIQPADVFLDVVGENLRGRTYVFTDPEGAEMCLRPDLTVPTCRLHLARHAGGAVKARYCYNGPTFRFQPGGATAAHPNEFRQAGLECFGEAYRITADIEVLGLTLDAVRAAGLTRFTMRLGDLGLFHALLEALGLPERWRERLRQHFRRPEAFRAELKRLATDPAAELAGLPADLLGTLDPNEPAEAEARIEAYLTRHGVEMVGTRTVAEVAAGVLAKLADARAKPMRREAAELIEGYLGIAAPLSDASGRLSAALKGRGAGVVAALDSFMERVARLPSVGVDPAQAHFSAEFGRSLEYYTGLVFEIVAPVLGPDSPVAGGGRYDGMLKAVGAPIDIPAVGAAIHTERLLSATDGGAS